MHRMFAANDGNRTFGLLRLAVGHCGLRDGGFVATGCILSWDTNGNGE